MDEEILQKDFIDDINRTTSLTYGYKIFQLNAVDKIIGKLNKEYGKYVTILPESITTTTWESPLVIIDSSDFNYIIDKLIEDKIIEIKKDNINVYKLLPKGRIAIQSYGSYREFLLNEHQNKLLDKKLKDLTIDNLQRSIFKQKHAILYIFINFIVTVGIALLTACLVSKFGWK